MDFNVLSRIDDGAALQVAVRKQLTADRYWKNWKLTDLLMVPCTASSYAVMALNDRKPSGETSEHRVCAGLKYKLKVLTRQACYKDKGGKPINGWDVLPDDGTNPDGEVQRPLIEEAAQPGDIVMVKGNAMTEDPDTGKRLTKKTRATLKYRGYLPHFHDDYTVDEDGCISVTFEHAMQLLSLNGQRIVMPQFKRLNKVDKQTGQYENQRKITNWHFKEVAPDYTDKKPTKDKK